MRLIKFWSKSKKSIVKKEATPLQTIEISSPAEMIKLAITGKADLDKLKDLLVLMREHEEYEAKKAYHRAMAEFKSIPMKVSKESKVDFAPKSGGRVRYNYASLANIVETITSELSKYGLSASWRTQQNGAITVICRITHVLGHSEETALSASSDTSGSKNSIQAMGSTITYLERYTLLAMLGIATSEQDDDGRSSESKAEKTKVSMPAQMPPKQEETEAKPTETADNKEVGSEKETSNTGHFSAISDVSGKNLVSMAQMNGYTKKELYEIIFTLGYTKVVDISKADYPTILDEIRVKAEDWRKKQDEIARQNFNE